MTVEETEARAVVQFVAITGCDQEALIALLCQNFSWMLALSPVDRETCARDLMHAAYTSSLVAELTAWRETAMALAAGLGSAQQDWFDEDASVELE
jgi:hypothetical protein